MADVADILREHVASQSAAERAAEGQFSKMAGKLKRAIGDPDFLLGDIFEDEAGDENANENADS